MAKSIILTEEAMNEIDNSLNVAAEKACSFMKVLISSLEERAKTTQIHTLKTATQNFIGFYNTNLKNSVIETCQKWREESGIVKSIISADPGNEDAINTARQFENRIQNTAESSISTIDIFNCSTSNPQITQAIYDECADDFKKALASIESEYAQRQSIFDSGAENNGLYKSCEYVLTGMLKAFEGTFEGGVEIFKKMGEDANLQIGNFVAFAKGAVQITANYSKQSVSEQIKNIMKRKK